MSNYMVKVTGSKSVGTHKKVLWHGIFMWNIQALAWKVIKRLMFRIELQTGQKQYAPDLCSQGQNKLETP